VSPVIHQAAYDELGMDARYGLEDCADEEAVLRQVEKIRSGELAGANVTVPWKKVAFDAADEWDQSAEDVGVANVLCRTPEGKIRAYNTDAMGLASDLIRAAKRGGLESLDGTGALSSLEAEGRRARRWSPAKWLESKESESLLVDSIPRNRVRAGPTRRRLRASAQNCSHGRPSKKTRVTAR